MTGRFSVSLSTLEHMKTSPAEKEALADIRKRLHPDIDPGAVLFVGPVYGRDIEETLVPYGDTWVPLHDAYYEVEECMIEEIIVEEHKADSDTPHVIPESSIEVRHLDEKVLTSIEELIVKHLDKNHKEIELSKPEYDGDI